MRAFLLSIFGSRPRTREEETPLSVVTPGQPEINRDSRTPSESRSDASSPVQAGSNLPVPSERQSRLENLRHYFDSIKNSVVRFIRKHPCQFAFINLFLLSMFSLILYLRFWIKNANGINQLTASFNGTIPSGFPSFQNDTLLPIGEYKCVATCPRDENKKGFGWDCSNSDFYTDHWFLLILFRSWAANFYACLQYGYSNCTNADLQDYWQLVSAGKDNVSSAFSALCDSASHPASVTLFSNYSAASGINPRSVFKNTQGDAGIVNLLEVIFEYPEASIFREWLHAMQLGPRQQADVTCYLLTVLMFTPVVVSLAYLVAVGCEKLERQDGDERDGAAEAGDHTNRNILVH